MTTPADRAFMNGMKEGAVMGVEVIVEQLNHPEVPGVAKRMTGTEFRAFMLDVVTKTRDGLQAEVDR